MSDRDVELAHWFYAFLEKRSADGSVTPESPMSSTRIIGLAAASDIKLSNRKIQRFTQYLRIIEGKLIGSTSAKPMGYALCRTPQEFKKMNAHLKSRAVNDWSAFSVPLKRHETGQTLDLGLEDPGLASLAREAQLAGV